MDDPLTPFPLSAYTNLQLHSYLRRIDYPNPEVLPPPTLTTLQKLVTYQLANVPFENLIIHYSTQHRVFLDPQHLYHKIVERGHGGYCMEVNGLFSIMLRSLGFDLWTVGGKVSMTTDTQGVDRSGAFLGWNHMIIIVSIDGQDYHVDVGFGDGIISAIPLVHGSIAPGVGSQQWCLLNQPLRHQANRSLPFWLLQSKKTSADPWLDVYAFCPNVEFSREDYEVMNYNTSTSDQIIFTKIILCIRVILSSELSQEELTKAGEQGDGEVRVVGRMLLVKGGVKRRIGDVTEELEVFETENQRVQALRKYFRLELTQKEQEGIRGRATEIK